LARAIYFTASTLDGFIADENDSLAWLFEQETDEGGPAGYAEFIAGVGTMVMGATSVVSLPMKAPPSMRVGYLWAPS